MSIKGLKAKLGASTDPNQQARISSRIDYLKSQRPAPYTGMGRNGTGQGLHNPGFTGMGRNGMGAGNHGGRAWTPPQRPAPQPQTGMMGVGNRLADHMTSNPQSNDWANTPTTIGGYLNGLRSTAPMMPSPEVARAQANLDFMRQYTGYGNGGMKPARPMGQYQPPQMDRAVDAANQTIEWLGNQSTPYNFADRRYR